LAPVVEEERGKQGITHVQYREYSSTETSCIVVAAAGIGVVRNTTRSKNACKMARPSVRAREFKLSGWNWTP
jgi:hypothetical protein